jgi:transcriptional regulator with XRE-family HTH domain
MTFKELRERSGFPTQQSLAEAMGRDQALISQIETGKSSDLRWSTMSALAKALKTTTAKVAEAIAETQAA